MSVAEIVLNESRTAACVVLILTGLSIGESRAQGGDKTPVRSGDAETVDEFIAVPAGSAVNVDGMLDDDAWQTAAPIPLSYETSPGDNVPAPVETVCHITFDADNLYLGCEARDPTPDRIRAYVTDRDDVDGHDRIGFTIDPFNDTRRAFEFAITALGVQSDGVVDQQQGDGGADLSWDAIWTSSGRITSSGFTVEAAIPFRSLRFPNTSAVQTWRFFAWRQWPRGDAVEIRSMALDRNNSCQLCQANLITGFRDISPGINLQLVPTLTSSRTDRRADLTQRLEQGSIEGEPGLDVQWGLTSDLTLNTTINPDFSQVEADVAQLDVNNRFALFFPEKRPFFLEGADLFTTPIQAVFTRSVADPVLGTKVTGKSGSNAVGMIVARDRTTGLILPGNQGSSSASVEGGTTAVFARFRRDVGASSTLGVLYTGREGSDYHNRVGGVDGFLRPWRPLTIRFQYLRSQTAYPDAVATRHEQPSGPFGGNAFRTQVVYDTRDWRVQGVFASLDQDFRADAGFVNQVDLRTFNVWGQRRFWGGQGGWFSRLTLNAGAWRNETLGGRLTDDGVWANVYFEGPLQTSFWINPDRAREFFQGQTFSLTRLWSGWNIRPSGNVGLGLELNAGDGIDFANARKAFSLEVAPSIDLRAGRRIGVNVSHRVQRLSTDGDRILTAGLSQLRTVYNFSTRTFVRAVFQYRTTDRNPDRYTEPLHPREEGLFTQLLFSFKANPQTVIFLGYADNRAGQTDIELRTTPLTALNRTFFLKLGYAWRP